MRMTGDIGRPLKPPTGTLANAQSAGAPMADNGEAVVPGGLEARGRGRDSTPGAAEAGVADEVLVRRLRDGDMPAGDALVARYHAPLMGYLQRLDGTEQDEKLRRAIDRLPEHQKQVLLLRYYSNLKFVEIAEMLGCPLNTALGRVHKAILKLRQVMGEE